MEEAEREWRAQKVADVADKLRRLNSAANRLFEENKQLKFNLNSVQPRIQKEFGLSVVAFTKRHAPGVNATKLLKVLAMVSIFCCRARQAVPSPMAAPSTSANDEIASASPPQ